MIRLFVSMQSQWQLTSLLHQICDPELPHETQQLEAPSPGRRSVPASVAWVPSVAGLMMGGTVVRDIIKDGGLVP